MLSDSDIKPNEKKIAKLKKRLETERMSKGKRDEVVKQIRSLVRANRRIESMIEYGIKESMERPEMDRERASQRMDRMSTISERRKRQRANAKKRKAEVSARKKTEASARKNNPVAKRQLPARRQLPAVRPRSSVVPWQAGRTLLGKLLTRAGIPATLASLGYQAYQQKKNVDASVSEYKDMARKIAEDSAALKAPPKRGTNVMIAGEKVKVNPRAMKALKKVEVKDRPMDKPAKAKEPKDDKINYNVGVSKGGVPFAKAFAHFRAKGAKEFTWNGKRYHTRTKEEEAAGKKKATGKALRRRRAMGQTGGYKRR